MIKLGNVVLNPSLYWSERGVVNSVAQDLKVTLGGRTVIRAAPLLNGQPVTLTATEESGWLTTVMVDELLSMASQPGAVFFLTLNDELVNVPVVFRHNEAPAVSLTPLIPKAAQEPGDFWVGTIKLIRI